MKKTILAFAVLFAAVSINAQDFYVALSGGPSWGASQKVLRTGGTLSGSYGEGKQVHLRGGYMFNNRFGVDLGVGYLYGDDQKIANEGGLDVIGRARAFGVALTGVFNVSENVYVRGGLLSKLGGRTDIVGSLTQPLPAQLLNPAAPATATVPLEVQFERDNKGSFPLGFVGAFGVKFKISKSFDVFTEVEYQGINVPAKESLLSNYSIKVAGKDTKREQVTQLVGTLPASLQAQFASLLGLVADKVTYVDNPNPANFETKSIDAPYSSFGFNFGVIYTFGK